MPILTTLMIAGSVISIWAAITSRQSEERWLFSIVSVLYLFFASSLYQKGV